MLLLLLLLLYTMIVTDDKAKNYKLRLFVFISGKERLSTLLQVQFQEKEYQEGRYTNKSRVE